LCELYEMLKRCVCGKMQNARVIAGHARVIAGHARVIAGHARSNRCVANG